MRSGDAQRDYLVATELYKEGRYEESLRLLDELQRDRPDSKHVLYYRGLCLLALGRLTEASSVCDRLSSHTSETGRRLTAKLSVRIADRVRIEQMEGLHGGNAPKPPPPVATSSDDGSRDPRQPPSLSSQWVSHPQSMSENFVSKVSSQWWKGYFIAGVLVLCLILAIIAVGVYRHKAMLAEEAKANAPLPIPPGPVPDKYLEIVNFYPAERERPYRFVVFMTPWDGAMPSSDTGTADECVGNAVAEEWSAMERDTGRAMRAMDGGDPLEGVSRDRMIKTLVLPRQAMGFTGPLQGKDVKTFASGRITDLAGLIASCGKPTRIESWEHNAKCIALHGKVLWWGRIGVAADSGASDSDGAITHVLVREYPRPEPAS